MVSGLYVIENTKNGKIYIGSAKDIENRFSSHKSLLNHNKHFNPHLQKSYNKYGEDNFKFKTAKQTKADDDILKSEEQVILDYLFNNFNKNSFYNMNPNADRFTVTDEILEKMSGKNHHNWKEPIDKECEFCGSFFEVKPWKSDKIFCSKSCAGKSKRDRVDKTCKKCGDSYKVIKSRKFESKFCSRACSAEYHMSIKENNPSWRGGKIEVDCNNCGDNIEKFPSGINDKNYCSDDCFFSGREELKGEDHGESKLSEEDVKLIKLRYKKEDNTTYKDLSEDFNISKSQVARIIRGEAWGHISI